MGGYPNRAASRRTKARFPAGSVSRSYISGVYETSSNGMPVKLILIFAIVVAVVGGILFSTGDHLRAVAFDTCATLNNAAACAGSPSLRGAPPSPVNVPLPARPKMPQGLSVLWMVYRGPAAVAFEPDGYAKVADGQVEVKATFTRPGTYTLRAFASDGLLRTPADVIVSVERDGSD